MSHAVSVQTSSVITHLATLLAAAAHVNAADLKEAKGQAKGSVTAFEKPTEVNLGWGNKVLSVARIDMVRRDRVFSIAVKANKDKTFEMVYDHMFPEEAVRDIGIVYDMMTQAAAADALGYQTGEFVREKGEWTCECEKA